ALPRKPFLVKPNREELGRTLGRDLRSAANLFDAMREINQRGAEWVLITDGRNPAYASCRDQFYRIQSLSREVVNPIGCGDCMSAGIAWATFRGMEPLDAFRWGVAVAADKVGQLLPGLVDRAGVEGTVPAIEVTRV